MFVYLRGGMNKFFTAALLFIQSVIFWLRFGKVRMDIVDSIDGRPCEYAFYDRNGRCIGWWAYGCYQHDPDSFLSVNGTQYMFQRINFPAQYRGNEK